MTILAIDIGGTKFSMAAFERRPDRTAQNANDGPRGRARVDDRRRSSRSRRLDRDCELLPARVGIGFGGPVDFARQTVALSTHVGGWKDFPLLIALREYCGFRP